MPNDNRQPLKRALLKITGEALTPDGAGSGIAQKQLLRLTEEVKQTLDTGTKLAIVTGGGNIVRGAPLAAAGVIERTDADVMGMLGTVINAVAIAAALNHHNIPAVALSALGFHRYIQTHDPAHARQLFEQGTVIVFGGGVGNPLFSTDTTAVLRAVELNCDAVLKATKVDGVYTKDPNINPDAQRYATLNDEDAIRQRLAVMDTTAFALAREHSMPIVVFNHNTPGNIAKVTQGHPIGTLVHNAPTQLA